MIHRACARLHTLRAIPNFATMDNANPVVHATQPAKPRTAEHGGESEAWWRDQNLAPSAALFGPDAAEDRDDDDDDDDATDAAKETIDSREVFDLVRSITDPEHPLTLEQLAVVNESHITVDEGDANKAATITLEFTPTIPHCSMATLIGLSLRVRLLRSLPPKYKVDIRIRDGTHQSENAINKQLNDKERVAAALENKHLLGVVQGCLASAANRGAETGVEAPILAP